MPPRPLPLPAPFDRRVQLFTGKGGVGKTSVVLGLALEAARRGHRPLIVELGHRASVPALLGKDSSVAVGYAPVELVPGVFAMNMTLDDALDWDRVTAALAAAHVSASPGHAVEASQAAADFVLQGDALMGLVEAIDVAKRTQARAGENLVFSALYNVVAAPLAALGFLTPLIAAVAMSSSSIIVTLNALRMQGRRA